MDKNRNIDQLIEETLNSMEAAERAVPMPWLLNRIHARLSKKQRSIWDKISLYISKPVVAIPALSLVLLLNVSAIYFSGTDNRSAAMEQVPADTADELQYNNGSFYDIVNVNP